MKILSLLIIGCLALSLVGCSEFYEVYLRNATTKLALLDVYLLEKSGLEVLPNRVKVTSRTIDFKKKVSKYVDSSQAVNWIDANHFRVEIQPNTTIDLTEMERIFHRYDYSYSHPSISIMLTANNKIDTLMDKYNEFNRFKKFKFIGRIPLSPSYYFYDIENNEVDKQNFK